MVKHVASIALRNAQSPIGDKYAFYRHMYNINFEHGTHVNVHKILLQHTIDSEQQGIVDNLLALFDVVDTGCNLPGFDNDELYCVMEDLLIN